MAGRYFSTQGRFAPCVFDVMFVEFDDKIDQKFTFISLFTD